MSAETTPTKKYDLNEVIARLVKGVRDPEAARKAREEMDQMREEIRRRIGTVDVAVELIRDARDQ